MDKLKGAVVGVKLTFMSCYLLSRLPKAYESPLDRKTLTSAYIKAHGLKAHEGCKNSSSIELPHFVYGVLLLYSLLMMVPTHFHPP